MSKDIIDFHEEELSKIGIPDWMRLGCPYCKKDLPYRSIRSVGLKFNTRNLSDVTVEVCCDDCSKMNTLYFRQEADTIGDFILLLNGKNSPKSDPVTEDKMYKMQYNNAFEKMVGVNKK